MNIKEYKKQRDSLLEQWAKWQISDGEIDIGLCAIGAFDEDYTSNKSEDGNDDET